MVEARGVLSGGSTQINSYRLDCGITPIDAFHIGEFKICLTLSIRLNALRSRRIDLDDNCRCVRIADLIDGLPEIAAQP